MEFTKNLLEYQSFKPKGKALYDCTYRYLPLGDISCEYDLSTDYMKCMKWKKDGAAFGIIPWNIVSRDKVREFDTFCGEVRKYQVILQMSHCTEIQ